MLATISPKSLSVLDTLVEAKHNTPGLRTCDLAQLLSANLPDPRPIIAPLLFEADLCMIYGWRGAGKTWFSLWLAYCMAAGISFLGWPCQQTRRVLILDGEMRAARTKGQRPGAGLHLARWQNQKVQGRACQCITSIFIPFSIVRMCKHIYLHIVTSSRFTNTIQRTSGGCHEPQSTDTGSAG